jgi:hypothetical protein
LPLLTNDEFAKDAGLKEKRSGVYEDNCIHLAGGEFAKYSKLRKYRQTAGYIYGEGN